MRFSENLKVLRKNSGMTQKELSQALGVALSTVAMWETGNRKPDLEMLQRIAKHFNVSVDTLFMENEELGDDYLLDSEMSARITPNTRHLNEDLAELREMLRTRPEVKMLFSASKNASREDIERTVAIIEALKQNRR
ncbi:MAG: helix-turn-helix transcriptional regulator [Eubacteriales bacterium]|nr:helix-turn-helix domain-containing protein [Clostridiales bacterium]MDD6341349.1 helix-turn-helix transcriptional regulator [Eubacteriales bacterium]MDD7394183.1 helix-turn-helix transcriptional regulator [Eubacteriales bacterium]MDY3760827.1 helix-turn-helix transcriptional regulator [Eubacteriales bacterium]